MNEERRRHIIALALRAHRGMLDECISDPALTPEERASFEEDLAGTEELLKEFDPQNTTEGF